MVKLRICITYPLLKQQHTQPGYPHGPGQQPSGHNIEATPASPGYDIAQTLMMQRIDTSADAGALLTAMLGSGCDAHALVRIFSSPQYRHPYAFQQLRNDYRDWFKRDLEKDIKGKTQGDFQDALVALARGPLDHDVSTLDKALQQRPIDEEALMGVLLCRSNADIMAITSQYRHTKGKDLLTTVKDKMDERRFPLYRNVISATRAEDAAAVNPADIDYQITELQRGIEENGLVVTEILTSANNAQLRAMCIAYRQKYHRSLQEAIVAEFLGSEEHALLQMLTSVTGENGKADADALREPLRDPLNNKRAITYRVLRVYWGDRARLSKAQAAYQSSYHRPLVTDLEHSLDGDYGNLMSALIGGDV
ncbi:hypothetical protein TGAMA5MH_00957 [Trichoderma gamsii]|uniref:Annexin n=1 Tax=Trichoderma gamsii TaxID=398673 RepID=A0A2K0TQV2_9HYPO|nr:hypothetical protein TGAMA5MH_00957 [Trichoderma gamsii]